MREKIEEVLKIFDKNVFYGGVTEKAAQELNCANFIVFSSDNIKLKSAQSKDLLLTYNIAIVRENFIDEIMIVNIINEIEKIHGLRLSSTAADFEYQTFGKSNVMIEAINLQFTRTVKREIFNESNI